MQFGFLDMGISDLLNSDDDETPQIIKIDRLINWKPILKELLNIYGCYKKDYGGERPYHVLSMFKAIFLGQWYDLSDAELRQALKVRFDYLAFCRFKMRQI